MVINDNLTTHSESAENESLEQLILQQNIVRMQFNGDGIQIIDTHDFKHCLEQNISLIAFLYY